MMQECSWAMNIDLILLESFILRPLSVPVGFGGFVIAPHLRIFLGKNSTRIIAGKASAKSNP